MAAFLAPPAPTTGLPAALAAAIAAFVSPAATAAEPPVPGWADSRAPYLPAPALEAILDTARLTQLYLGESWPLAKRATRDKHLARMQTSTQFDKRFEDPADPMWSQRLSFHRGPGSSFSPEEIMINRDGKNIALALRWESRDLYQSRGDWNAILRMDEQSLLVREAWSRLMQGITSQQGVPQAIISPILLTIQEILDSRSSEALIELSPLGAAGKEISGDMLRQKAEITALFKTYNESMATLLTGSATLHDVARRTNGIWYALLHPAMLHICAERSVAPEMDPLISQAETACATPNMGKRPGGAGSSIPNPPGTAVIPTSSPDPAPAAYGPPQPPYWPWVLGHSPTTMAYPASATMQQLTYQPQHAPVQPPPTSESPCPSRSESP